MEGMRCSVECWADFGDVLSASVMCHGPDVILSTRTEHIFVFSVQERRVKASRFFLHLCYCFSADEGHCICKAECLVTGYPAV